MPDNVTETEDTKPCPEIIECDNKENEDLKMEVDDTKPPTSELKSKLFGYIIIKIFKFSFFKHNFIEL